MPNYPVEMRLNIPTSMRDEVALSSDLYLPRGAGAAPTVLMRTPYSNNMPEIIAKARTLAGSGYACVVQDVRGRWDSNGQHNPFHGHAEDGYDTHEWIGRQEWSNGRIGMAGASYLGLVQWAAAHQGSAYLTCLAPRVICGDFFKGLLYPGGAFQLNVALTWGMRTNGRTAQNIDFHNWAEAFRYLPVAEMDELAGRRLQFWKDWLAHPTYDEYWAAIDPEPHFDSIAVPAFNMGGWYDLYSTYTFTTFNDLIRKGSGEARRSRLIVGPWPHRLSTSTWLGDVDFGVASRVDLDAEELRWFDYWLKGIDNGIVDEPPLRLFIMGTNVWRDEHEWPLDRTDWQKWHLHSSGGANTVRGDGGLSRDTPADETPDRFVYDPAFPVQTVGGNNCCSPELVPWGPYDQRAVEMRSDVLVYTSGPLEEDLEVTGPIKLVLHAATDGPDTDWTGKLVDVAPNGFARNLCDGILRARCRESLTEPSLLEANRVYEYEIDLMVTGNVFLAGHRIRLEVASSNFPRFDRNPNTGHDMGADADLRVAHQTVHHDRSRPSHLLLPVIPTA